MMNPVVASAKYKDWSTAKQAGFVVESIDTCQKFVGTFRHKDIIEQTLKIRKHYRGNAQFQDGSHRADISGADVCTDCAEMCMKYKDTYIRLLNQHFSRINSTSTSKQDNTQKNIENCLRLGRVWDYVDDVCEPAQNIDSTNGNKEVPNKEITTLEKIERKCTELGFTKGTEKHGDCVMKLYK
jgi:hypothetical protein